MRRTRVRSLGRDRVAIEAVKVTGDHSVAVESVVNLAFRQRLFEFVYAGVRDLWTRQQ